MWVLYNLIACFTLMKLFAFGFLTPDLSPCVSWVGSRPRLCTPNFGVTRSACYKHKHSWPLFCSSHGNHVCLVKRLWYCSGIIWETTGFVSLVGKDTVVSSPSIHHLSIFPAYSIRTSSQIAFQCISHTPTSSWRSTFALCLISSLTMSLLPCSACTMRGVVPSPLLSSTFAPFLTSFCTISAVVHLNSPRLLSLAWKKTLHLKFPLSYSSSLPSPRHPFFLLFSFPSICTILSIYFVWWKLPRQLYHVSCSILIKCLFSPFALAPFSTPFSLALTLFPPYQRHHRKHSVKYLEVCYLP